MFLRFSSLRDLVLRLLPTLILFCAAPVAASAQFANDSSGQSGNALAPATDEIENGGLRVKVLFVGKNPDGQSLTISAELKNATDEPLYLALIGPPPSAIDTQGVSYSLEKAAGLSACKSLQNDHIAYCMTGYSNYLPPETFTKLGPAASSIVALTFRSDQASTSGFLSVAFSAAVATGAKPAQDRSNNNTVENVALSFPLIALEE